MIRNCQQVIEAALDATQDAITDLIEYPVGDGMNVYEKARELECAFKFIQRLRREWERDRNRTKEDRRSIHA